MSKGVRKSIEGAKSRSLTIHFTREEDIQLFDRVLKAADEDFRRPAEQFVLKLLHNAYPPPIQVVEAPKTADPQGVIAGTKELKNAD